MAAPFALRFDLPFTEALAQAAARRVVLPDVYYGQLQRQARSHAFTVSGMTAADQIAGVLESLQRALGEGRLFRDWKAEQLATLAALPPSRAETIYRNAVQTAYSVGRTQQQRDNKARRPFLMWDAINDGRTRPTHRAMDGYIAPVEDPIWQKWCPPAGHRCRCSRIALTEAQARARGYPKPYPGGEPDPGWDYEKADGDRGVAAKAKKKAARARVKPPEPPDNLPATKFVPQATAKAAAAWARTNDLADSINFGKLHVDVANALNQSLYEHLQEFPELRKNQRYTGTAQGQFAAFFEVQVQKRKEMLKALYPHADDAELERRARAATKRKKMDPGALAHSWAQPQVQGIGVNEMWGKAPEKLKAALAKDVASGFHPVGGESIKSIVDHELGHQLDDLLQITRGAQAEPEIEALWSAYLRLSVPEQRAALSGYGGRNRAEFLAEAWAEYRNNPKPRPIAQAVGEFIVRRYGQRFPQRTP